MSGQAEIKPESLPDLDDLLQCPVCYEIPSGQIFQCNEGHHVCGRCKIRLDVCPVCRALFFGTRNYAMEELIANVRKLRAFKLGGKVTTDTVESVSTVSSPEQNTSVEVVPVVPEEVESAVNSNNEPAPTIRQACKGMFRCVACKTGVRLPLARLLNHLRYFHAPELIEGKSENGEYVQAWQFSTVPGRIVTAVRIADMGIFFLVFEITDDSVCAWLSCAATQWVAHEFCYTITISGNDREAIFTDSVWSTKACEGTLKKRGNVLVVNGLDARALTAPEAINGRLCVRRTPHGQYGNAPPRAVLRIANRMSDQNSQAAHDLEPFLQDLQNDVARLSRAFATLGLEANALVRSEAEMRARIENQHNAGANEEVAPAAAVEAPAVREENILFVPLSRNARRRQRQRLRAALNAVNAPSQQMPPVSPPVHHIGYIQHVPVAAPPVPPPAVAPSTSNGPTNDPPHNGARRNNKKKRRQHR